MSGERRALLIGSQTHGLEGPEADVERVAEALAARRFTVAKCTGALATRDGIVLAYERLINEAHGGDAICVYYSGHGGRLPNPFKSGPRFLQYLVPTDHGPGSFRGLMSFELSALLAELTRKTANVTLIFDCCHAGQMSRAAVLAPQAGEPMLVAKGLSEELGEAALAELLQRARARGALLDAESNPYALRLLATEPHVSAYEEKRDGISAGIFTRALLAVLAERGERRASWGSVMLEVREQVMARKAEQRPDVEGPRRRLLFGLEELPDRRPLALLFDDVGACVRGGALVGALPGSRFGIMSAGSESYAAEKALGEALVTESLGSTSRVELSRLELGTRSKSGLLAFPLSVPFRPCRIGLGPEISAELGGLFADSPYVALESIEPGQPLPSVRSQAGELVLRDADGAMLLCTPETQPAPLLERLECMARAGALRDLEQGSFVADLNIEFGRVENGSRIKLGQDEALHVGDRQYLSVVNDGDETAFVAVLCVDAKYSARLLSRSAPRGQLLRPNGALALGKSPAGDWLGLSTTWPEELVADAPRRESLIVIAAEDEQDFPLLTTSDAYSFKLAHDSSVPGDRGGARGQRGEQTARTPRSEYVLYRLDYVLDPTPRRS